MVSRVFMSQVMVGRSLLKRLVHFYELDTSVSARVVLLIGVTDAMMSHTVW